MGTLHALRGIEDALLKGLERATGELDLAILVAATDLLQVGDEGVHAPVGWLHVLGIGAGHQVQEVSPALFGLATLRKLGLESSGNDRVEVPREGRQTLATIGADTLEIHVQ